jgi:hypothetical protein
MRYTVALTPLPAGLLEDNSPRVCTEQYSAVYYKISWQIVNSVTDPFSSDATPVLIET